MSKLEKQQDKLLGQDLIQNLEDQLDLLEKQKAAQEIKLIRRIKGTTCRKLWRCF